MAKKYYAVQCGRHIGVYDTWAACEAEVKGYGGAKYKSFSTKKEAEAFALGKETPEKPSTLKGKKGLVDREGKVAHTNSAEVVAYIDGSFDKRKGIIGYGGIIFWQGTEETFSLGTKDEELLPFWNVAGELLAAMHVMRVALEKGAKTCALYYDYMGIEMWATGRWKANNHLTRHYVEFVSAVKKEVTLEFHKVAAHQGDKYNELVDRLAKEGLMKA